jgi:hypothetical protein
VALAAANDAPRIVVNDGKVLLAAWHKGVVEVVTKSSRLLPSVCRISQKHAQEMASAGLAFATTICLTSMHDTQVIYELDVALLAVKLGAKAFCELFDGVQSMHLLGGDGRHAWVAVYQWRTQQWGFDQLTHRLSLGKE